MKVGSPSLQAVGGHYSLMLWLSWARVCASPQMSSHSAPEQSSYSMSLCKQWNRKCPGFRILGERKCRVWALWSASPYQKVEGIMMIICPVLWGKGGQRWNVLSANSDKQDWLISIQKSAFLCRGPAPAGSRCTLRMNCIGELEREKETRPGCAAESGSVLLFTIAFIP